MLHLRRYRMRGDLGDGEGGRQNSRWDDENNGEQGAGRGRTGKTHDEEPLRGEVGGPMGSGTSLVPSAGFAPGWRRVPTLASVTSTTDHLNRALSDDPSGPRLTFYDDATGERIELSTTTLANWVAKTVNLLTLECEVGPGSVVSLHLPRHWTTAVWVLAADAVGAEVNACPPGTSAGSPVDVAVIGPDRVDDPPDAEEVFAVSLEPLAAPFRTALPTLVRDYTLEVRAMPDQVSGPAGPPGLLGTLAEARAADQGLGPSDRVAALGDLRGLPSLIDDWLAPLAVGASVLWVRNPEPDRCVPRWATERVTAVSSALPNGVVLPEAIRLVT